MQLNETKEEYQYINNSHDKIFRKILDKKEEAVSIINRILENDYITTEEIEKYNSSYISENLRNSEADIVYKVKNQDVFFLIEHQTKIDYSMPYRILKYEVEIIESALNRKKYKNKQYKYPLVIPIVLYTGNKEWNAKVDLRRTQVRWSKYENKELSRYNVIDVNRLNDKQLLEEKTLVSKILLIEKSDTEKELEMNLNKIIEKKQDFNQEQLDFLILVIELVLKNQLGKEKTNEFINKLKKEGKDMLAVLEMLDRENARIRNEGRLEGRMEARIDDAKNMLKEKLPIDLITRITGMKKEQIEKIKKDTKNETKSIAIP